MLSIDDESEFRLLVGAFAGIDQLVQALTKSASSQSVHRVIVEAARNLGGGAGAALWLFDPTEEVLRLTARTGIAARNLTSSRVIPLSSQSVTARVAVTMEPIEIDDIEAIGREYPALRRFAQRVGISRFLLYPLVLQDQLIGVLDVFSSTDAPHSPLQRQLLSIVARIAGIAIDQDRGRAELSRRMRDIGSIEELVLLVSHDLRSAVSTIIGRASMISSDGSDRDVAHAQIILQGAWHVTSLAEDLADAARHEMGQLMLHQVSTDLDALAWETVEEVPRDEDRRRVRILACPGPLVATIDRDRIGRVLMNLLANALKYSPSGSAIEIQFTSGEGEVVVSVVDQGIGIDVADLPHIFEKSYRGSTTGQVVGLGLGLYVARLIVEAHGGRIWATSVTGQGSVFSFTVPLA